jgi:hypothetical protein
MITIALITEGKTDQEVIENSLECWLLPLYYDNKHKSRTKGCLDALNRALKKSSNTQISGDKQVRLYDEISTPYTKHKTLMRLYKANPSLHTFILQLERFHIFI